MTLERVDVDDCQDRLQVMLHRQRYDFVLARLTSGQRVLEIGTGPGAFASEILPRCASYIGVEYDPVTCLEARKRTNEAAQIIEADARNLPLADEQFSFIICLEVLEHLGEYQTAVHHIHRCLEPAGMAIISVPYRRIGGRSHINEHHLYEPGEHELVSLFKRLFAKVEVYYQYFEETAWMTCARKFHIRRFVGLTSIYADLTAGKPNATSRVHISQRSKGMRQTLLLVISGKKHVTYGVFE